MATFTAESADSGQNIGTEAEHDSQQPGAGNSSLQVIVDHKAESTSFGQLLPINTPGSDSPTILHARFRTWERWEAAATCKMGTPCCAMLRCTSLSPLTPAVAFVRHHHAAHTGMKCMHARPIWRIFHHTSDYPCPGRHAGCRYKASQRISKIKTSSNSRSDSVGIPH